MNEQLERFESKVQNDEKRLSAAKQCLIDNGIEEDEAESVLQALCYILLDKGIY